MSLLKNRNYLILLSGQLVSTIGDNLYSIALPWFVLVATNSRADLAITGFFQSVAAMTGLFTGVLVDRWRKKQTMITSDIIRGLLSLSLFILALDRHSSVHSRR